MASPPEGPRAGISFGFLAACTAEDEQALRAVARTHRYPSGATLFRQGAHSDVVVIVLRGRVKVSSVSTNGHESILAFRGAGEILGELSVLDQAPCSATVTAAEEVEGLVVTEAAFRDLLMARPRLTLVLLEMLVRRLRDADRKRLEFGAYDTVGRVSRRLVELAEDHGVEEGGRVRITLGLSQDELAGWTGSSREAVARALASLRKAGLITTDRRRIVVIDIAALRRTLM